MSATLTADSAADRFVEGVVEDGTGRSVPLSAPDSPRTIGEAFRVFARHGSPRFLMAATAAAIGARLALGNWTPMDAVVVAVIHLAWPVQEWLIHVFLLHWEPKKVGPFTLDFAVPISHRAHHRDPWNIALVFVPLQGFFISLPLLALVFGGLFPSASLAMSGLCFYMLLSLRYEWIHFLVHTRYQPRSAWYRRLWRNHRLHHCKNEKAWFGVTMLGGDRLFRTAPDPATTPLSPTCRSLGIESAAESAAEPG